MSIRTASASGIVNNQQRDFPIVNTLPYVTPTVGSYTRPADWPALASMTSSDSKFLGLLAVTNDTSNYLAMLCTNNVAGTVVSGSSLIGDGTSTSSIFGNLGTTLSATSNTAYTVGMYLYGTNVEPGTYITAKNIANFTSTISGSTLTVSAVSSGTITLGMVVSTSTPSSWIIGFGTGSGGAGTYILNQSASGSPTTGTNYTVNKSQTTAYVTISGTTSYYSVDWGDGAGAQNYATGQIAQNQYNYSTLGTSVTTRGYKTALVTITPGAGTTFTTINLQQKFVPPLNAGAIVSGTLNAYVSKWLDISLGSPSMTSCAIGGNTTPLNMLEQVSFYGAATSATSIAVSLFTSLFLLQSVPVFNLPPAYISLQNTFLNCRSLKNIPTLPSTTHTTGVTCGSMFNGCNTLEIVPNSVFANLANKIGTTSNMFQGCSNLRQAPELTWSSTGGFQAANMFTSCLTLTTTPQYNLRYITNVTGMFSSCSGLINAPYLNTTGVTTFSQMFDSCRSLVSVPSYNLSAATFTNAMFQNCFRLTTVPVFNMPAVTDVTNMFAQCYSLQIIPQITTGTPLLSTSGMFSNCFSLTSPPLFNTINVTSMNSMFFGANNLVTIATYNTANVTNMSSAFQGCNSLSTLANLTTTKVINMESMFQNCGSLIAIPAFDTGNVTNMTSMFAACPTLSNVAFTNVNKVTNMFGLFNGCSKLTTEALTEGAPNSWNTSNVTAMQAMFQNCVLISTIPTFNTTKVTNTQSMLGGCTSLNSVPAMNFSNVTSGMTNMFQSNPTLSNVAMTNVKVSLNISSAQLSKTALEDVFLNRIVANTTSQTITITANPGTDTAVTKTGTATANSNVITMANTVSLTANMILTSGNGFGIANNAATLYQANSQIVLGTGQAPANGMPISIATAPSGVTGYTQYQPYYVANSGVAAANAFQISTSNGGGALSFTGTGSLAGQIRFATYITTVNANANIIVSNPATAAFTGNSYVFRTLDVSQAVLKNWTVTG